VCVTGAGAGVNSVWEWEKLEAAQSPTRRVHYPGASRDCKGRVRRRLCGAKKSEHEVHHASLIEFVSACQSTIPYETGRPRVIYQSILFEVYTS
jgi:hypothetical protein